jgi:hypothetical protein
MVGVRPRGDAETVEQHPADAGILAGNEVGASKRLQPADGHVAEIADWRRDQIEPGLERPCSDLVRADAKRPWRLAAFPVFLCCRRQPKLVISRASSVPRNPA